MRSFVQAREFVEFLLGAGSVALAAQSEAEIVVRLLEVGLQFDSAAVCGNRTGVVAVRLQFATHVVLRLGIVGVERHSFAKLSQSRLVVRLPAQSDSQHVVSSGQTGIRSDSLTKLCGRLLHFAALSFHHAEFQMDLRRGFQL